MDEFLTAYRKAYGWPSVINLEPISAEPPANPPRPVLMRRGVDPWCHCDLHAYDPQMDRYRHMADKEHRLFEDLLNLNKEMQTLASDILQHPCDTDDPKMKTFQQIDYQKRSYPILDYRALMTAIDSPVGVPVKPYGIGLRDGYKDPTRFRYSAIPKPIVKSPPDVTLARCPSTVAEFYMDYPSPSEYMDSISRLGLSMMRSRQQYLEPLPSTRRQKMDPCII